MKGKSNSSIILFSNYKYKFPREEGHRGVLVYLIGHTIIISSFIF